MIARRMDTAVFHRFTEMHVFIYKSVNLLYTYVICSSLPTDIVFKQFIYKRLSNLYDIIITNFLVITRLRTYCCYTEYFDLLVFISI